MFSVSIENKYLSKRINCYESLVMTDFQKVVKHTLKILQHLLKDFLTCS